MNSMRKESCRRLAKQLGWREITTTEGLLELGISPEHAVDGNSVWIVAPYYKVIPGEDRWMATLDFDPWENANDDLLILEFMKGMTDATWNDYKDCLYHETKGHGTHNVWDYKKGKFANAAIILANKLGWK